MNGGPQSVVVVVVQVEETYIHLPARVLSCCPYGRTQRTRDTNIVLRATWPIMMQFHLLPFRALSLCSTTPPCVSGKAIACVRESGYLEQTTNSMLGSILSRPATMAINRTRDLYATATTMVIGRKPVVMNGSTAVAPHFGHSLSMVRSPCHRIFRCHACSRRHIQTLRMKIIKPGQAHHTIIRRRTRLLVLPCIFGV